MGKKKGEPLTAKEVMEKILNKDRCDECCCAVGDDWQFVDFTNKTIIACPQCKTLYALPE